MAIWTLDKFLNPSHAAAVFTKFYRIGGLGETTFYLVGAVQAIIVMAFLVGICKRFTYGLVLLMHAVSTLSAMPRYLDPWTSPNLLFFAAWPMLAATFALYLLRDQDTLASLPR